MAAVFSRRLAMFRAATMGTDEDQKYFERGGENLGSRGLLLTRRKATVVTDVGGARGLLPCVRIHVSIYCSLSTI